MKKFRQILEEIKNLPEGNSEALQATLWQLICYSPKIPNRLHQQRLVDDAEKLSIKVYDRYFSKSDLNINCFKWGKGKLKILLTHGWSSKGSDFSEIITALRTNENIEIWTFDAPGNGSSEGDLSNLFLYAETIKTLWEKIGEIQVVIGHSLGAMANALVMQQTQKMPELLISIAPLINLKNNFIASMQSVNTSEAAQQLFFEDFEKLFEQKTEDFVMHKLYDFPDELKHVLIYEQTDLISPKAHIEEFLNIKSTTIHSSYEDSSHSKLLIDTRVISHITSLVDQELNS